MTSRPADDDRPDRTLQVLAWVVGLVIIGWLVWGYYRYTADLNAHGAEFKGLLDHGQGFADRWLADVSADPAAAYRATTAAFRERVSADEWKAFVAARPELRASQPTKMVSVGGGSVGFSPLTGRGEAVPPKGVYRADPGGVEVVVVYEGEALRVDRVRAGDAGLPAE